MRGIEAKVTERLAPISDTLLSAPSAGGNDLIDLRFDLDSGDAVIAMTPASSPSAPLVLVPFFSVKNISLEPGESVDLQIQASSRTCLCRYRLDVEIVTVGSTVVLQVTDTGGRPLAVSAQAPTYANSYLAGALICPSSGIFLEGRDRKVDCSRPA